MRQDITHTSKPNRATSKNKNKWNNILCAFFCLPFCLHFYRVCSSKNDIKRLPMIEIGIIIDSFWAWSFAFDVVLVTALVLLHVAGQVPVFAASITFCAVVSIVVLFCALTILNDIHAMRKTIMLKCIVWVLEGCIRIDFVDDLKYVRDYDEFLLGLWRIVVTCKRLIIHSNVNKKKHLLI